MLSTGLRFASPDTCGDRCPRPKQQARIAIRIKPIATRDRVRIGLLHRLQPGERRHQHEQRRARQMEIGQQDIDRAKAIARRDEDRGLARKRLDGAVLGRSAFEQPQRGGADRDDTAAPGAGRVQRGRGLGSDAAPFGVHPVLGRCRPPSPAGTSLPRHAASGDGVRRHGRAMRPPAPA